MLLWLSLVFQGHKGGQTVCSRRFAANLLGVLCNVVISHFWPPKMLSNFWLTEGGAIV
jgi:hypothetical protein